MLFLRWLRLITLLLALPLAAHAQSPADESRPARGEIAAPAPAPAGAPGSESTTPSRRRLAPGARPPESPTETPRRPRRPNRTSEANPERQPNVEPPAAGPAAPETPAQPAPAEARTPTSTLAPAPDVNAPGGAAVPPIAEPHAGGAGAAPANAPPAGAVSPAPAGAPEATPGAVPGNPTPGVPGAPAPQPGTVAPTPEPSTDRSGSVRVRTATPPPAAPAKGKGAAGAGHQPVQILPTVRMNWGGAFDREPLGFDLGTPARVGRDLSSTVERVAHRPGSLLQEAAALGPRFWAALGGLAAFILAGAAIERRRPRAARRVWVRFRSASRRNAVWRSVTLILGRAALPLSALTLWTVGSLLAGVESAAVVLIQNLLGIWAGFRLADEGVRQLFCGGERTPAALYGALHGLFVFAAFWLSGWLLMDAATYREDAIALWLATGHLTLVLCLFGILLRRDQLLALLPELDSSVYRAFLRVIRAVYYPLIYGSFLVALLWVGGYQKLAGLFLGRSWAVVGTCLAALLAYRLALQLLRRWIGDGSEALVASSEALAAGQRLLEAVAIAIALVLGLKALGIWTPLTQAMGRTLLDLGDFHLTGSTLSASLLILVAVALFSRLLQALMSFRVYPRVGVAPGEAYALNRLTHYALMAGALLLVLNTLGLSPSSLALVLGGLSVGIGFGLQDIANNIASGLIMLTSRQVRQGDVITVGDRMGTVREVNLRSTVVTTPDNVDLLIPNSKLLGDTVINWTHSSSFVRTKVPFGVSYNSNPREVMELALTVGRNHPEVLADPEPAIWFLEMADNSLNFELYVWVDMAKSVRPQVVTEIYCRLFEEFNSRDIQIPYPQRDLHLRSGVPWEELIGALKSRGEEPQPDGRGSRGEQPDAARGQVSNGR